MALNAWKQRGLKLWELLICLFAAAAVVAVVWILMQPIH